MLNFSYNEAGLLNSVVGTLKEETTTYIQHIEYDHFGKRTRQVNGNGTVTDYEYNYKTGLLVKILTNKGETTIQDLDYIFDNVGNITEITDNVQASTTSYEYDDLYRLTNVINPDYSRTYSYDSIGNITNKSDVGDYEYSGAGPHAVTKVGMYEFEYDANGNMTRKSYNDNEKFQDLSYDYDNRVTTISNELNNRVDFVYDYTGRRIKKVYSGGLDTTYVNNFYEFKSDGTVTKHIFDGTRRIVSKVSGVGPTWYHTDHLGSTNLLTDESGDVIQHTEYYPYGETRISEGEDITQYKFTGQEFDPETGLYYFRARYYDPHLARFISADILIPEPFNPQSFNRYSYVLNNPLIYTDPSGHALFLPIIIGAAFGGLVGGIQADNFMQGFGMGAAFGAIGGMGFVAGSAMGMGFIGGSIFSGALSGGIQAAITGQDIGMGILVGAGMGLLTAGASSKIPVPDNAILSMLSEIAVSSATGALTGGLTALAAGEDFGEGARKGAIYAAATSAVKIALMGYKYNVVENEKFDDAAAEMSENVDVSEAVGGVYRKSGKGTGALLWLQKKITGVPGGVALGKNLCVDKANVNSSVEPHEMLHLAQQQLQHGTAGFYIKYLWIAIFQGKGFTGGPDGHPMEIYPNKYAY